MPVLQRMERHGVLIDRNMLQLQSREIAARLAEIQSQAHQEAGVPFNLESPNQLQQILFERLGLPVLRKTSSGVPSTAEDVSWKSWLGDRLPLAADQSRVPRALQATLDLHRAPTGTDQSRYRSRAHQLPPGRGRDRPPLIQRSESAEHSDPQQRAVGAFARRIVAPKPGLSTARSRLFADRAANHGAPVRRRRVAASVQRGARHPPGHSSRSARSASRAGVGGSTAFGQGDQLRAHLWDVRLWAGAPARRAARDCSELRRAVLRALSRRTRLYAAHAGTGPPRWLCAHHFWTAIISARHRRAQSPAAAVCGAQRDQCADAGQRGRTSSSGPCSRSTRLVSGR